MRLAVFTHVMHKFSDADYFAYGPYVREMNLWFRNFDLIEVVAPVTNISHHPIDLPYGKAIILSKTRSFELTSFKASFRAIGSMPFNIYQIVKVMRRADHIHLRCPGNIGLLACVVQIFFPGKRKTAKYAGNWDPESHQPWSYKLQRWILSNTFLTRNMQVLVYGNWEGQSANIKPFFTATYRVSDKAQIPPRTLGGAVKLMFAGTLSSNKQPLYAVQLLQELQEQGVEASLEIFGDGELKKAVTNYIRDNNLTNTVRLNGNRASAEIAEAYRESHFLILPSKSEGWPKVVAEAMFWGCIPVSTAVSCVPDMLGNGERGILIGNDLPTDTQRLIELISNEAAYSEMSSKAVLWSHQFTQESFESEIEKLLSE